MSTTALFVALGGSAYAISLDKGDVTSRIIRNDTIRSQDVKRNGVKGSDVNERTLRLSQFSAAVSTGTGVTTCTPPDNSLGPCGEVALTMPVAGRVLGIAGGQRDSSPATASGGCQLLLDGKAFGNAETGGAGAAARDHFSIVGVSDRVSAGTHTVALQCFGGGITGDIAYRLDGLTAVLVGGK